MIKLIDILDEIKVNLPISPSQIKSFKNKYSEKDSTTLINMFEDLPEEFHDTIYDYLDNMSDHYFDDPYNQYKLSNTILDLVIYFAKQGDEVSKKYVRGELPLNT